MFESSHPFAFFDYVRVPYTVEESAAAHDLPAGIGVLRGADRAATGGRVLLWSRSGPGRAPRSSRAGRFRLDGFTMAGHLRRGVCQCEEKAGDEHSRSAKWESDPWHELHLSPPCGGRIYFRR